MEPQKEFFDFFKKEKTVKKTDDTPKETPSKKEMKQSAEMAAAILKSNHKVKMGIIAVALCGLALLGLSHDIEYSGWLIFLAFCILT